MSLDCEIVLTRSGAPAVRDRITGEVMHPVVGPLVEAQRLYVVPSRLEERLQGAGGEQGADTVRVLDVGLGAASNAIAAWRLSESMPSTARRLEVVSFDRSIDALDVALASPSRTDFGFEGMAADAARALLTHGHHETARTSWRLVRGNLPGTLRDVSPCSADVVFWDPFSPKANPELWSFEAFCALRALCRVGATVHTYSGATAVRSALLLAGFSVGLGEPIGARKHSTLAAVDAKDIARPLDARWLERLSRSSAPFPTDAPGDALSRVVAMSQFATSEPPAELSRE